MWKQLDDRTVKFDTKWPYKYYSEPFFGDILWSALARAGEK
jgi:hypothetical protein